MNGRLIRIRRDQREEVIVVNESVRPGEAVRIRVVGDQVVERHVVEAGPSDRHVESRRPAGVQPPASEPAAEPTMRSRPASDEPPFALFRDESGELRPIPPGTWKRQQALEVWAAGFSDERVKVWSVYAPNLAFQAMALPEQHVTILNTAARTWRCPVLKLAVLAHELHHVERGDRSDGRIDPVAESECDQAAELAIVGVLAGVERKQPALVGPRADAATCVGCFRDGGASCCRQSESTLARILAALEPFMNGSAQ